MAKGNEGKSRKTYIQVGPGWSEKHEDNSFESTELRIKQAESIAEIADEKTKDFNQVGLRIVHFRVYRDPSVNVRLDQSSFMCTHVKNKSVLA